MDIEKLVEDGARAVAKNHAPCMLCGPEVLLRQCAIGRGLGAANG